MHILVVDDDAMVGAMVSMILEDADYEVTVAPSAEDALSLLMEGAEFTAIISDLNMPGIDGIELFHKLRQVGCDWPFILLSGDDPVKLRQRAPDIDEYLAKDDTLEDTLAQTVARVVASSVGKLSS